MSRNARRILWTVSVLIVVTAAFALLLRSPVVVEADTAVFLDINKHYNSAVADGIAFLETFGLWVAFLGIGALLLYKRKRDIVLMVLLVLAFELLYVAVVKNLVDRPRPFEVLTGISYAYTPTGSSFPSDHTAGAFAIFTALGLRFRKGLVPLLLLAALIGFSRVYIGVHFPLDVVAGACIGIVIGLGIGGLDLTGLQARLSSWWRKDVDRAA